MMAITYDTINDRRLWLASLLAVAIAVLTFPGCTKNTMPKPSTQTVAASQFGSLTYVVQDNYSFSLYSQTLMATDYGDTLSLGKGPYTIFAPNNDAFSTGDFYFGNSTTNYLLAAFDPPTADYVRGMIVPQAVSMKNLPMGANQAFPTLDGGYVYITKYREQAGDTVITVNGVPLVSSGWDQPATNGTLNVLSSVPEPTVLPNLWQLMCSDGDLAFFTLAIQRAGLVSFFQDTAAKLTVLAPTNDGMTNMYIDSAHGGLNLTSVNNIMAANPDSLKKMIMYHVLPGLWFMNDFNLRDTLQGIDTVQLTSYSGVPIGFTYGTFYGSGQFLQTYFNYNTYTTDTILAPLGVYPYSRFVYDMPRVTYQDQLCFGGVVQQLDGVLLQ